MSSNAAKGILGGICISLGAMSYLCLTNIYLSAFMFFIGLWLILVNDLHLFTGRIGYLSEIKYLKVNYPTILKTLLYNTIGILVFTVIFFGLGKDAINININKLDAAITTRSDASYLSSFLLAILCGILINAATTSYKVCKDRGSNTFITPLICVFSIVFAGAFHCISDIFFIFAGVLFKFIHGYFQDISVVSLLLHWMLVALGNTFGAMGWHYLLLKSRNERKNDYGFEKSYTSETYRGFSD